MNKRNRQQANDFESLRKRWFFKLQALWLLFSFLFFLFYPSYSAIADPLIPYALVPNSFDNEEMAKTIEQANTTRDLKTWETMVYGRLDTLRHSWEADMDAKIQSQIAAVFHSDSYNDTPAYKDYLKKYPLTVAEQDFQYFQPKT